MFGELDPDSAPGRLFVKMGVDITDASTLSDELLEGVTQIVSAVGPVSNVCESAHVVKPCCNRPLAVFAKDPAQWPYDLASVTPASGH